MGNDRDTSGRSATSKSRASHITDARGRSVSLLDPYAMRLLHRQDTIPAETLARIAGEIGPGVRKWQGRVFLTLQITPLAVVIGGFIAVVFFGRVTDALGISLWAVTAVCIVIGITGFLLSTRRKRLTRVAGVMLKHLRCPHCGYDLRLLPTDPADGATICPECGCAWALLEQSTEAPTGDTI